MCVPFRGHALWVIALAILVFAPPAKGQLVAKKRPKREIIVNGVSLDVHVQKVRTRCALPLYDYGWDDARFGAVVGALFIAEEQVVMGSSSVVLDPDPLVSGQWASRGVASAQDSILAKPGFRRESVPVQVPAIGVPFPTRPLIVRRKRFQLNATAITVDPVRLDQVQLSLYETGQIVSSGRIVHLGGPNPGLLGNNITVRVRAYAGIPLPGTAVPNGPLLWQGEKQRWLPKLQPQVMDLCGGFSEEIQSQFDEIRFMEVNLEYRKDR